MSKAYSNETQMELVRLAQQGDDNALELLVESYSALLHREAIRYSSVGMEHDDLYQEGAMGLIEAIRIFDFNKSDRLYHYALKYIRGYCQNALTNQSRVVRIPYNLVHDIRKQRQSGCVSEDTKTQMLHQAYKAPVRLDAPVYEDGVETKQDRVVDTHFTSYPELKAQLEIENLVSAMLDELPDQQAMVMRNLYGIGCERLNGEEIAKISGCSRQNINYLKSEALSKLRKKALRLGSKEWFEK